MDTKQKTQLNDHREQSAFCGIIMPIADMAGYEKGHWLRVREVLDQAIQAANYVPRLVSESEDTGIIHANIVQNLYDDSIVVCDVSGKNANVMFELGLRLAFDKPTIIVKDDKTDYSFDTSPIKHIPYRADLRFDNVREFQEAVAKAVAATVEKKKSDPDYSPFLKHFHRVKITELQTEEVGSQQFILNQMQGIQKELARLSKKISDIADANSSGDSERYLKWTHLIDDETMEQIEKTLDSYRLGEGHSGTKFHKYAPLSSLYSNKPD
ncbi:MULTISPECIES: hypothetical protein [Agrobacterium]|uniref:hypothetical protein n=1 Tax=Agrobacterium TaxID=357 RepID=UPI0023009CCC|nr:MULTISPECIES: hypothetical protein [Agrobacterium]MDA5627069.1 hypothetical protein [Agrobacterium sp. ST15.16.055]MDA6980130.1 hypothetical protein [Agrobacterium salinitolerans]